MVYVDNMNRPYGDMKMCHMIADTHEELVAMADSIGVKRKWIQKPGTKQEHFDICLSKKKLAIKAGAQEVSMLELGYMLDAAGVLDDEPINIDLVALAREVKENPDFKSNTDISARVNGITYRVPWYCLADFLWGMPDEFYPCDKYEWANHPLYLTSVEMVKQAVTEDPNKFKAFILP